MPATSGADLDELAREDAPNSRAAAIEKLIADKTQAAEEALQADNLPQALPVDYTPNGTVRRWSEQGSPMLIRAPFYGRSHMGHNSVGKEVQLVRMAYRGDVVHLDVDDEIAGHIELGYLQPVQE